MRKILVTIAIVCATLQAQVTKVSTTVGTGEFALNPTQSVNPVIEWNRTLLVSAATPSVRLASTHREASSPKRATNELKA